MEWLQAIILGAVQGLTEFLPVSSSGHLIFFPALFGWRDQGIIFDALVHFGTFFALLWYFKSDILSLVEEIRKGDKKAQQFIMRVGAATLPALVLAWALNDLIELYLRSSLIVAGSLFLLGRSSLGGRSSYREGKKFNE